MLAYAAATANMIHTPGRSSSSSSSAACLPEPRSTHQSQDGAVCWTSL